LAIALAVMIVTMTMVVRAIPDEHPDQLGLDDASKFDPAAFIVLRPAEHPQQRCDVVHHHRLQFPCREHGASRRFEEAVERQRRSAGRHRMPLHRETLVTGPGCNWTTQTVRHARTSGTTHRHPVSLHASNTSGSVASSL
jgi:hypothetical protein